MTDEPTSLTVQGTLDNVARIRGWLGRVLDRWHVTAQMSAELKLAVSELCTNIVRHGYGAAGEGDIEVSLSRSGHSIQITIEDDAPAFEPRPTASPPPDVLAEGGYGLYLVHSLIDELIHERIGLQGNRTTLIKHVDPHDP